MEVLRRLILEPRSSLEVTLIAPYPLHHYSGMVPGYIAGAYAERELTFDLPAFAERAGARFVQATALSIDHVMKHIWTDRTDPLPYDFASFNVGSLARGADAPDVAAHAVTVKPMSKAADLRQRVNALAADEHAAAAHVVVVGGGSGGVEVAWAVAAALDAGGREREVSILEASSSILAGYSDQFRQRAETVLAQRHIHVRRNVSVRGVTAQTVEADSGETIPSDLTIWLTGAAASSLFKISGLPVDPRGFLLVDDMLRSTGDPTLFGAGDCVTLAAHPNTPKAGVYAVRQAPYLWSNLVEAIDGSATRRYTPQRGFLSILNTADGKALLRYGSLVSHSRWAWRFKDWIDRRFVDRYQRLLKSEYAVRSHHGATPD